jgi:hypothetical protein
MAAGKQTEKLRRLPVRAAQRVGLTPFNRMTLEMIRRPEWLYRGRGRIPRGPLEIRPAAPVTDGDLALCERLIAAYHTAIGGNSPADQTSGMWSWIFDQRQQGLAGALDRRDASDLASQLASMFQQEFMVGISYGNLIRDAESGLGARLWSLKTLDGLVSLAEALDVAPAENPEQGSLGLAFEGGLEGLVAAIEGRLGASLDFPAVGAAYGIRAGSALIPPEWPEQIYAASRLLDAARPHGPASVVEIGAGYGAMAYWFLRLRPSTERYWIVDLPIVNVLQGYFLSKALGPSQVALYGEPPAQLTVVPNSGLHAIETPYDVLVNKDSMPEMPEQVMLDYLSWARTACEHLFFSYNQEASADFEGQRQQRVSSGVARTGGFTRVRRDPSWVRRGYVEEIYKRST